MENEDIVGAGPKGDAPTTSEWSTIWLPTKVWLILETSRYYAEHYTEALKEVILIEISQIIVSLQN